MIRRAAVLSLLLAAPAAAQDVPPSQEALFEALQLDRVVALMREEGVEQGLELADDLFPGQGGAGWRLSVERVYDEGAMRQRLLDGVSTALEGEDVDAMTDFFASPRGKRIVELELSAREAMAEEEVDEAARAAWSLLPEEDHERALRIERFVAVNDLVEENVEGALNANLAFMRGMNDGGAFLEPLPEEDLLVDVWAAEPEIRAEMEGWLGAFLSLAYEPLEDADLDAYIAFSETEEGQALNRALFEGFDAMYEGMSLELGRSAAAQMVGQDI
jgi:hypothetical protein